jgi:hypothetical protein
MHKSATKCNETIGKWCKNKHGASKIIDTFETYQFDLIKICLRSRWHDRSADKIIVFGASKITQLGVLLSTHSSKTKNKQVKVATIRELFFLNF